MKESDCLLYLKMNPIPNIDSFGDKYPGIKFK